MLDLASGRASTRARRMAWTCVGLLDGGRRERQPLSKMLSPALSRRWMISQANDATMTGVTIEASGAWTHGGSFASYHEARQANLERREHNLAVYEEDRKKLEELQKQQK